MISTQVTSKDKKLLDLAGCSVVRGTDRGDGVFGGAFAFAVIAEDGSRLCLQAENEDERLRWVSALRRATGAPLNDFASIGAFQAENPACAECASDEADWVSTCVEINQCVGYAALALSSGEEPASPRHRAGIASMAWRTTRRFRTDAP